MLVWAVMSRGIVRLIARRRAWWLLIGAMAVVGGCGGGASSPEPGGWTPPETLATGDASLPAIAVTRGSLVVAAWPKILQPVSDQLDDGTPTVVAMFDDGTWRAPVPVGTTNRTTQDFGPAVAANESRDVVVAWVQLDSVSGVRRIVTNRFDPGRGWGAAQVVDSAYANSDPKLIVDADGNATLAWTRVATRELMTSRSGRTTPWSSAVSHFVGATSFDIAVGPAGDIMLAYAGADASGTLDTWAVLGSASGAWQPPTGIGVARRELGTFCKPRHCDQRDVALRLRSNPRGDIAATWEAYDALADAYRVWVNVYTRSAGWGLPFAVGQTPFAVPTISTMAPAIAIDDQAGITVLWRSAEQATPGIVDIWTRRYSAAAGWGPATLQSPLRGQVNFAEYVFEGDGRGALYMTWVDAGVFVATWGVAGDGAVIQQLAGDGVSSPRRSTLAVERAGQVTLMWLEASQQGYVLLTRRSPAPP